MTDRLLQMFWHEVDTRTGSGRRFADRLHMTQRAGWTMRSIDVDKAYQPLGVDGGIRRSVMHMEALAELLRSRGIGLTVAVYPWPFQLFYNDRKSRQVEIWRTFCEKIAPGSSTCFRPCSRSGTPGAIGTRKCSFPATSTIRRRATACCSGFRAVITRIPQLDRRLNILPRLREVTLRRDLDVLEVAGPVVDADLGRRDPRRELARLDHRLSSARR